MFVGKYGLRVKKCNDIIELAERTDNPHLKTTMQGLIRSYERWEMTSFGTDGAIRSLQERRRNNSYQIGRLLDLCKALAQRETECANSHVIDDIRGEIARYRHEISAHESENADISNEIRALKERSGT